MRFGLVLFRNKYTEIIFKDNIMKVKSIQAHGVAIALLYALRRVRRSSRVADVWVQASVVAVMIAAMSENITMVFVAIASLAAASAHSKSLKEE